MVDITLSGRKVQITDALRAHVQEKISSALKVFDMKPMSCDVVLRVDKNPSNPDRKACEVTVFVRSNVVRVVSSHDDMYVAIDEAAEKVARQLRKYKTRVLEKHHHKRESLKDLAPEKVKDLSELLEPLPEEEDDQLVREKVLDLYPMTEEEALVQTDLLGHDFFVFTNATTGLVNVIYHRKNGGYGIIKPRIEEQND